MYAPHSVHVPVNAVTALVDACLLPACDGERIPGWIMRGLTEGLPGVVLYGARPAPAALWTACPDALVGRASATAGAAETPAAELVAAGVGLWLGARSRERAGETGAYVAGLQGHGVAAAVGPFTGAVPTGPYAEAVAAGVRAVGVGTAAALDGGGVRRVLRAELGFDGVAVSEPLDAPEVVDRWGIPGAAVLAWIAGLDLLRLGPGCGPGVRQAIRTAAARAVADGDLPVARLTEAAGRVARLRRWAGDPGRIRSPAELAEP